MECFSGDEVVLAAAGGSGSGGAISLRRSLDALGDELLDLEDPRRRRLDKRDGRRSLGGSKSVTCTTGEDAARWPACDVRDVVAERDSGGRELLLIRCQSSMRRLSMKTSAVERGLNRMRGLELAGEMRIRAKQDGGEK